ncbi:winged helix-turn-helix domain-containing protein [Streptomyces sp. MI02-7b]|uniref:ArsR/SmtB family transcription factor n=1 Tax=Streptomyces sp. MI02-7b TaxID=462941 RepID=UPI0029A054BE|nr:winged helix-turn-helix domain-containing protein [Streptomyces sp. MI02-7b]MDX3075411.1 winged helix-turn-helix domain-containing protein [Streptomyces sp. MI02-7b]
MTLLRMSSLALSRSRFALSPLAETLASMMVLAAPYADPWLAPWHARHRGAFLAALDADPFAKGLVRLLGSTKWMPAHVVLPPTGGMRTVLDDELAHVATMPDAQVRAELEESVAHSWEQHALDQWLSGRNWAARTADLFRSTWTAHVAPDWPRRRALLERDVTYRAGLLAAYGWPRALEQMSRRSAWVGTDAIRFSDRPSPDRFVGEDGMQFIPIAAISAGTWLCEAPPASYALVYPARGSAATDPRPEPGQALARLIGTGRAAILHELRRPATTSELAAQLGLSLGTVGGHLTVLRDADLVTGTRIGRRVVYHRTTTGDLLAGRHQDP